MKNKKQYSRNERKHYFRNNNVSNAECEQITQQLKEKSEFDMLGNKHDDYKLGSDEDWKHAETILNLITGFIVAIIVILILFTPKCSKAQINSDTKHFYCSFFIKSGSHQILKHRIDPFYSHLISAGISSAAGISKEYFDKYKGKEISKNDIFINHWGILCAIVVDICIDDHQRRKIEKRNYKIHTSKNILN